MIHVEIITIGDELLIGQIVDTNSAWMAQQLNKQGFDIRYKTTVGDNEKDILDAFERAFSRASVVLVTGGIGPTKDDITKHTLCRFFNTRLVFDPLTLQTVEEAVRNINRQLNELTRKQAYVPESATIIQNQRGTAPITWFERGGKVLVSMPGVPYEMKWVMTHEILPRLEQFFHNTDAVLHQSYWVKNYSESMLAMHLNDFEEALPECIKLAYLPTSGLIRLRLTAKGEDKERVTAILNDQDRKLRVLLANDLVSDEEEMLEVQLHRQLIAKGLTLGIAESCTGGMIAHLLTAQAGSSSYLKGGIVSYSNEAKVNLLDVRAQDIETHGAVSQTVVEQMALGAARVLDADCSMATSGIAGPDGGTPDKPVGTVWIAVTYKGRLRSELFRFSTSRESNIQRAAYTAIRMLLSLVN